MLRLYPMAYSRAKSINQVLDSLRKAPLQVPNTIEAFKGWVMEFYTSNDIRPGTLDEYYKIWKMTDATLVLADGEVTIARDTEGNWNVLHIQH